MENNFNPTTYKNKYININYDRLNITIPKGRKKQLQQYCQSLDISVNKLINTYIESLPLPDSPDSDNI